MHDHRPHDMEPMYRGNSVSDNRDDDMELPCTDDTNQTELFRESGETLISDSIRSFRETHSFTGTTDGTVISPLFSPGPSLSEQTGESPGLSEDTSERTHPDVTDGGSLRLPDESHGHSGHNDHRHPDNVTPPSTSSGRNADGPPFSIFGSGSNLASEGDSQNRRQNDATGDIASSQTSRDCSNSEIGPVTYATNVTNTIDEGNQYSSLDSCRSPQPGQTSTDNNLLNSSAQCPSQITYKDLNIVVSKPKRESLATQDRRLATFRCEAWPKINFLNIEELVQAGLYFAGYSDCCRCFFCGGGLRNWEEDDNPFVEHARWFSKCAFIGQKVGQDFIDVVADLNKETAKITIDDVKQCLRRRGLTVPFAVELQEQCELIENHPDVLSLISEGFNSAKVLDAALDLVQNNTVLSADGILSRIQAVSSLTSASAEFTEDSDNSDIQEMNHQNSTLRENFICKICLDKEIGVVFLPCGHFTTCQDCAWALSKCPVCRRDIIGTTKATFSM